MLEQTVQLGTKAQLKISDDGTNVSFSVYFPWTDSYDPESGEYTGDRGEQVTDQFPWTVTINGAQQSLRSSVIRKDPNNPLGSFWTNKSQSVIFHLEETNDDELGGPLDYSFYVSRADALGVAYITVAGIKHRALPFVRVAGIWRNVEPYSKYAGDWKQTT